MGNITLEEEEYKKYVAFATHEDFRKNQLKKNGEYKAKWKIVKDADYINKYKNCELPNYLKKKGKNLFINVTEVYWSQLSPDFQKVENKILNNNIAKEIQESKPLSKNLLEVYNYFTKSRLTGDAGSTLDEVAKMLEWAGKEGYNIYYEFNGRHLFSSFDTVDTCYVKLFNMNKKETAKFIEGSRHKLREEYQEEME